jgi:hypothetical protein
MELLDQLEAESPDDPSLAPKVRAGEAAHAASKGPHAEEPLHGKASQCMHTAAACARLSLTSWGSPHVPPSLRPLLSPLLPVHAPQDLAEWSVIYIRYLQIFRRLEAAYDQVVHPQKRQDIRRALEACMGRTLEVRHWMVRMGGRMGGACGWSRCRGHRRPVLLLFYPPLPTQPPPSLHHPPTHPPTPANSKTNRSSSTAGWTLCRSTTPWSTSSWRPACWRCRCRATSPRTAPRWGWGRQK